MLAQIAVVCLCLSKNSEDKVLIQLLFRTLDRVDTKSLDYLRRNWKLLLGPSSLNNLRDYPLSSGLVMALGLLDARQDMADVAAKWIGECSAGLKPATLMLLDDYFVRLGSQCVESHLMPVINRLLLRSSHSALAIMAFLTKSLHMTNLFTGDTFWTQLTSENDENREKAAHLVLAIDHHDSTSFYSKLECNFASKTVKVKKTLGHLCFQLVKARHEQPKTEMPVKILKSLLANEMNEEVIYYLVASLASLGAIDLDDALRQPKAAIKTSYIAGLASLVNFPADFRAKLLPLLIKKDTPALDQLLICSLIVASTPVNQPNSISNSWIKSALAVNGPLTERCINEVSVKYPFVDLTRLCVLFRNVSLDAMEEKTAWRLLLGLYCSQSSSRRTMDMLLSGPISLSLGSLDMCIREHFSFNDSPHLIVGKLVKNLVTSRGDLLPFVITFNSDAYLSKRVWKNIARVTKLEETVESETLLKQILACTTEAQVSAIVRIFPEASSLFASHLASQLELVSKVNPSAEDLCILGTPDEQLPVIDVVSPLRKTQEAAAKKDPTRVKPTIKSGAESSLSKAESAAFEAEVIREKAIKTNLLQMLTNVSHCAMIVNAMTVTCPHLFESHLGDIINAGVLVASQNSWIAERTSPLLYGLAGCCASPPGRFGPLLVTLWYSLLRKRNFIDKDWTITDSSAIVAALVKHLPAHETSKSTFSFVLPFLLELFSQSSELELDELHAQSLLQYCTVNCVHGLSISQYSRVVSSVKVLVQYLPSASLMICSLIERMTEFAHITSLPVDDIVDMLCDDSEFVRHFGLQLVEVLQGSQFQDLLLLQPTILLWAAILAHESSGNSPIARRITSSSPIPPRWENVFKVAVDQDLVPEICSSAAKLVASLTEVDKATVFASMKEEYRRLYKERFPTISQVRAPNLDLTLVARERLAMVYQFVGKSLVERKASAEISTIPQVIEFFVQEAFFDVSDSVHGALLDAAGHLLRASLDEPSVVDQVATVCDSFLAKPAGGEADRVRVYAVILLAQVAERFPAQDPRKGKLLDSLSATLSTPSESVQNAAADAMVPLFSSQAPDVVTGYLKKFLQDTSTGSSMAKRRGAAFGLGAWVKGVGSKTLESHKILSHLTDILQDKGSSVETKQGALFGLELIARYLGRLFEPYIVRLLVILMGTFAEGRVELREATIEAAQTMMASVSSLGARILLPVLLELLNSTAWRTKVGAIEWLGAMAALAPRVLSKQLPVVLPRLVSALADSHHGVQRAAREALTRYGSVVRNPEIRALSATILEALANPPQNTAKCLHALLHTAFAHIIDGPSLALLDPILERALRDRAIGGTEGKKRAAQIIGNLATNLVDPLDLVSHLPGLVPSLLHCLSDPVPEVRAHCGKVLGILVAKVGEKPAMMSQLAEQLMGIVFGVEATSVDRAGAAQALAEILAARGPTKATDFLEQTVMGRFTDTRAYTREGAVLLVGYLAPAFDSSNTLAEIYSGCLRPLIAASLTLLADENEAVREAATEACHNVISRCARIDHVAIFDILLDSLSTPKWRCRLGCLKLFQEFLGKFSVSVGADDDTVALAMPTTEELLQGGIDETRIRSLMSKAFLYRFDLHSSIIRHHALAIWKGLASHPLRALVQILPDLLEDCCIHVDESDEEGRQVVNRAVEDMLGKLGDRLLGGMLDQASQLLVDQPEHSVGCLFVLTVTARLLGSGSFPGITTHLLDTCVPKFIAIVQSGLANTDVAPRIQTGRLFVHLLASCDSLGVDSLVADLVGPMLDELVADPVIDPITLDALVVLLQADESGAVLDYSIDRILHAWRNPIVLEDDEVSDCATALAEVTRTILQTAMESCASYTIPLLRAIIQSEQLATALSGEVFDRTCASLLAALDADDDSPYQISLSQLLEALYAQDEERAVAFAIVRNYCAVPEADLLRFYDIWPKRLVRSLSDTGCGDEAQKALLALLATVQPGSYNSYHLAMAVEEALKTRTIFDVSCREVIALLVKGVLVPLLTQPTLLASEGEERRDLASRLIIHLASAAVPSPLTWSTSLTTLVGALIRTAGDKHTTSSRIFAALTACVVAQTTLLKPFHPQLQRIFTNALHVENCRESASAALSALLTAMSRPEGLVSDLFALAMNDDPTLGVMAFEILTNVRVVGDVGLAQELASAGLAHADLRIRDAASLWVRSIIDKEEVSSIRPSLASLLQTLN